MLQRLNKTLAQAGICSRRASEKIIAEHRVTVNGKTALEPQFMVDPEKDNIKVDGSTISLERDLVYYMLNKPINYLCSNKTSHQREKLVLDLFHGSRERLFTIGRLDKDSCGLLLVTNDGDFGNKVIHPSSNIEKEYLCRTDKEITHEHLCKISKGAYVEGTFVKPCKVKKVRRNTLKVTVKEGKKREVRTLLHKAELKTVELRRIRIGSLKLGLLPEGSIREVTERERELIFSIE
jgi:23S rRNA pseudouridine2605 synthase